MDRVIDIDVARAMVADAALWPRARDFLWDFAPQVHPSWLEGLDRLELLENLESNHRVKTHILSKLGIAPCFHSFPKDDWSRLVLLDGSTLESIAKWLGALACADELRRVTDGATVRELKAALPGVYPEVFGYTMYFKRDEEGNTGDERDGRNEAEYVISGGFSMLMSFLAHLPDFLISRLKFKLPRHYSNSQTVKPSNSQTVNLPLLLKLRFPEAHSLCC